MEEEAGELPLQGWDFTLGVENPSSSSGEVAKEETSWPFLSIQRN